MNRRNFIRNSGKIAAAISVPLVNNFSLSNNLNFNNTINIGIIGTGDRGGGLIPFINQIENLNVVACCDILPFRLENGIKKSPKNTIAYKNYKKLLENKDIDAVLIATPFSTHYQIASDSIDAGKHVYCEKTMVRGIYEI